MMKDLHKKPHLSQFLGRWHVLYTEKTPGDWVTYAIEWSTKTNVTKQKLFGSLDIRYNKDRHGF